MRARPRSEWTEQDGDVLWWHFPICEPPYLGSPLSCGRSVIVRTTGADNDCNVIVQVGGWQSHYTHWTPFETPEQQAPIAARLPMEFGDVCRARCTAPARYIKDGVCGYISSMCNDLCCDIAESPTGGEMELPFPSDAQLRALIDERDFRGVAARAGAAN